jgi:hypothetical protein
MSKKRIRSAPRPARRSAMSARRTPSRSATPSSASVAAFYLSYPELLVRTVEAAPAPWWLGGRRTGVAISSYAPPRLFQIPVGRRAVLSTLDGSFAIRPLDTPEPLGSVPASRLRSSISAVIRQHSRLDAAVRWSATRQSALLKQATCRRDDLPQPAAIDLTLYLPFLELSA